MSPTATASRRAAASHAGSAPRRAAGPRPQRRVSGPLGGRLRQQVAPRESVALGERALALVRGLPDHSLIDRLVRGRAWIPVLGVLLAGIVAMQVEILKLGTSMGRAMERSSALQTRNEALQASVATLADDQRIERLAAGMGMVMPRPDSFVFLSAKSSGDIGRAIANIHAPNPVGFTDQLAAEAAAAAALLPPAPPTVSSSTGTGTTSTTSAAATPSTASSAAAPAGSSGVAAPATTTQLAPTAPSPTTTSSTSTSSSSTSTSGGGATTSGAAALAPGTSSQSGAGSGG